MVNIDSGFMQGGPDEDLPSVDVEIPQVENFEGGAEVVDDGQGGAIIRSLLGMEDSIEVDTEEYDHDANLAEVLSDSILGEISSDLRGRYEEDLESSSEWREAYTKGLDLLGIKYQERTEPFQGASGVTHPLLSESVTQFQAQAYKEMLPSGGPVRTHVLGSETPQKQEQSNRVKEFMNYQITEVMEEFDPDTDQMLFYLPLSGSTFKKVYFDTTKNRAVSKFVPSEDLIIPYSATDLNTSPRVTHVLRMDENEVRKMQVAGIFKDVDISAYDTEDNTVKDKIDEIGGINKTESDDVYNILEIHADLDIEGFEDLGQDGQPTGIKLPYVITIDNGSGEILSITRNYDQNDPMKRKRQYFVHYKFLPGLGFYGFGLIHMIGGLGRAATSILRQLIDAGTLANLPSGFKARGIRIRNDDEPLSPGEFRDIDAPGGSIRDSIIPLPFKEPSGTLAQLLGSLIDGGRRFVSIADQQVSNMSQDMPVGTTVALLERGMKVMSAIHKRLHYAQKTEFRLLARIFSENLPPVYPYEVFGAPAEVKAQDFDGRVDILPVSDPNIFSMAQRVTLAQTQLQLAQSNPQLHNLQMAYRRMYQALEVQNIEEILPPPPQPQPMDPSAENAVILKNQPVQVFPEQDHDAHMIVHLALAKSMLVQTSPQALSIFYSHLLEHVSLKARNIAQMEMQEMQMQAQQAQMLAQSGAMDPMMAQAQMQQAQMMSPQQMEARVAQIEAQLVQELMANLAPPPGQQQDPLVEIRKQELQIKAAEAQRRAMNDQERLDLDRTRMQQQAMTDAARIELQEEIAEDRADVNRERIDVQRQAMQQRG
jgi:hypothetical protein|tara:strand:- start:1332 stop:3797 length:2466 start_codon:yes stop_codon:yes gene_type:complete